MTAGSRQTGVIVVLFISILIGGAILNALSHNPLSASAFCLSRYYHLAPVGESVDCRVALTAAHWNEIEIRYGHYAEVRSETKCGSDRSPKESGFPKSAPGFTAADCHFIVCDDHLDNDGQIKSTRNWRRQLAVDTNATGRPQSRIEDKHTIYICVATNGENTTPSDAQIRRTDALVEELRRRFRISRDAVRYAGS